MHTLFLDANILFSAAYSDRARVRTLWDLEDVTRITSAYAVEEARRNLATDAQRAALETLLTAVTITTSAPILPLSVPLRDKDVPILCAAIAARATHLITGDVRDFGPYFGQTVDGVLILPPAQYLALRTSLMEERQRQEIENAIAEADAGGTFYSAEEMEKRLEKFKP